MSTSRVLLPHRLHVHCKCPYKHPLGTFNKSPQYVAIPITEHMHTSFSASFEAPVAARSCERGTRGTQDAHLRISLINTHGSQQVFHHLDPRCRVYPAPIAPARLHFSAAAPAERYLEENLFSFKIAPKKWESGCHSESNTERSGPLPLGLGGAGCESRQADDRREVGREVENVAGETKLVNTT